MYSNILNLNSLQEVLTDPNVEPTFPGVASLIFLLLLKSLDAFQQFYIILMNLDLNFNVIEGFEFHLMSLKK